jgi:hypothetical protein
MLLGSEHRVVMGIDTLGLIAGKLPKWARRWWEKQGQSPE